MAKSPKRRKYKDNPYTLLHDEKNDTYYAMFKDVEGHKQIVKIDKQIYEAMNQFELDDLSEMNEYDNHIEHSEVFENTLNKRILHRPMNIEELVETNYINRQLKKAINYLSEIQKRRINLYFFQDKTVEEIAKLEKTTHQAVSETIRSGIINIRKNLKNEKK